MSKLIEMRGKRNEAMRSAQAILLQDTVSKEDRSNADGIFAEVDAMEAQIEGLERVEKFEAEQRAIPAVPRPNPGQSTERSDDEKRSANRKAMEAFIRRGVMTDALETRDLTTGSAGAVIAQAFYPSLIDAQKAFGGVANIVAKRVTDTGAPMKISLVNDTANGLTTLATEQTVPAETDPAFTGVMTSTDEVSTGIITVSWAELQDSQFDLDSFIRTHFGIRYARGLAQLITQGNASNVAALNTATVGTTSAAPTSIGYTDLTALYGALDPAYEPNGTWVMNSTTRAALMGILSTTGQPIFIPNPQTGAFDVLFGRPVVLNQYLANVAATNVAVQYGDFSQGYLLRSAGEFSIVRLNERFADKLSTGFIGYARVGGVITDAGTHPILSLKQHA
jgi:HK97 family phage major capsid protein